MSAERMNGAGMPSPDAVVARLRAAGCVFAEEEAELLIAQAASAGGGSAAAELERMLRLRVDGLPLEHVLGWVEFHGLRIEVGAGVFVPRRRTELVVTLASELLVPGVVVVDLCCGAGAIGAALSAEAAALSLLGVEVFAADIDPVAVRWARVNLPGEGRVFEGDLFSALPDTLRGRVGILTVNAPYVPSDEIALMPPEARLFEAPVALDGGADGLDVQRRVLAEAAAWLTPGGHLLVETSERQAPATLALFETAGLRSTIERDEELDGTAVVGLRL